MNEQNKMRATLIAAFITIISFLIFYCFVSQKQESEKPKDLRVLWRKWEGNYLEPGNGKKYEIDIGFREDSVLVFQIGNEVVAPSKPKEKDKK